MQNERGFFMRQTKVTLSIFHSGQFFTAIFEAQNEDEYRAARRIFAKKPLDNEIVELISNEYYRLRFSKAAKSELKQEPSKNPKRRQREAAKAAKKTGFSTKAQQTLKNQQELNKKASKKRSSLKKQLNKDAKYEKQKQKRKEKHRGH